MGQKLPPRQRSRAGEGWEAAGERDLEAGAAVGEGSIMKRGRGGRARKEQGREGKGRGGGGRGLLP